jgi:hypothetical protein
MDWQKYPKNRKSIRIQQPETLDSKKCPTFPGMGGKTTCIQPSYNFNFFVPKVLIEKPAHTNSFICVGRQWRRIGFYGSCMRIARARQSEYPPYIFLHFSQDFSREKFFSTFYTNFLEKMFSRENVFSRKLFLEKIPVNFFFSISHEISRIL